MQYQWTNQNECEVLLKHSNKPYTKSITMITYKSTKIHPKMFWVVANELAKVCAIQQSP